MDSLLAVLGSSQAVAGLGRSLADSQPQGFKQICLKRLFVERKTLGILTQHQALGTSTDFRDLHQHDPVHHRMFLQFVLGRNAKSVTLVFYSYQKILVRVTVAVQLK